MLLALPGVDRVDTRGDRVIVHGRDSDAVARYLLNDAHATDLEIVSRNLEDAFLALTTDSENDTAENDLAGSIR